jgi:hypothetical protein
MWTDYDELSLCLEAEWNVDFPIYQRECFIAFLFNSVSLKSHKLPMQVRWSVCRM